MSAVVVKGVGANKVGRRGNGRDFRVLGRRPTMALELRLGPVRYLTGEQCGFRTEGHVPRVAAWRGRELGLAKGRRVLGRPGVMAVWLKQVGRRWRVWGLGRGHSIEVVGTERRLLEEGSVEVIALATRGREQGEVAVVDVGRQVGCGGLGLRLRVEGEDSGVGTGARLLLAEGGAGVEEGRVGDVGLRECLRLLTRSEKVGRAAEGVEARIRDARVG